MGAEQSNSSSSEKRSNLSKAEVDRLLQQQKELYEQKLAELMLMAKAQQRDSAAAELAARQEARKEVERIMAQKKEQLIRQNEQLNNAPPQPPPPAHIERNPLPYTCAGSALTNATLNPSAPPLEQHTTPTSIYPQLSTISRTDSVAQNSNNRAGFDGDMNVAQGVLVGRRTMSPHDGPKDIAQGILVGRRTMSPHDGQKDIAQGVLVGRRHNTTPGPTQEPTHRGSFEDNFEFVERPRSVLVPLPRAPSGPRDRSIPRSRNNARRGGNEDDELNCPSCKNRYQGNIYQCSSGHSSCRNCKLTSRPCRVFISRSQGACGLPLTDMRNHTLEAYMSERKVHCPYSDEGCCLYLKLDDLDAHLKECPFQEMICPLHSIFGQCTWKGKLSNMENHFDNVHQMHRQANVDTELTLLNPIHNNHIVYFVVIGTYNFLFHVKISEQKQTMYMAAMLLGTEQSASKWTYEIHIYKKNEPRRKYQYTDICHSGVISMDELIAEAKCATLPIGYAKTFINESCLTYKFFIRKEIDARNDSRNNNRGRGRGGVRRRGQNS